MPAHTETSGLIRLRYLRTLAGIWSAVMVHD